MCAFTDGDGLALWAHKRLAAKNSLTADDARVIEMAYQLRLQTFPDEPGEDAKHGPSPAADLAERTTAVVDEEASSTGLNVNDPVMVAPRGKEVRRRSKAHLLFVAAVWPESKPLA